VRVAEGMLFGLDILKKYMPTVYKLFSERPRIKEVIAESYEKRLETIQKALAERGLFSARTTMFDLLRNAAEDNQIIIEYLGFIDRMVESLLSKVCATKRSQIVDLVLKMFLAFNDYDSQSKNHFAEIATLSKLLSDSSIKLIQIEKKLTNGKSLDFAIEREEKEVLVEVYSIDFDLERIESVDGFSKLLHYRIEKKLEDKLAGLTDTEEVLSKFVLVPVLWGEIKSLGEYAKSLDSFKEYKIITPFMMVAQYKGSSGNIVFDFQTISFFLEQAEKIEKRKISESAGPEATRNEGS
jgi:hypothetical protein